MFNQAAGIAAQIQSARQEADSRLQSAVETINPLLEQIDKLNKTIAGGAVTNQDVTGAQNAQLGLINELSKYMDVKVEPRSERRRDPAHQCGHDPGGRRPRGPCPIRRPGPSMRPRPFPTS